MNREIKEKRQLEVIMEEWNYQATVVLRDNIEGLRKSWSGDAAKEYMKKMYQLKEKMEKTSGQVL